MRDPVSAPVWLALCLVAVALGSVIALHVVAIFAPLMSVLR